jgi:hypothetical protein
MVIAQSLYNFAAYITVYQAIAKIVQQDIILQITIFVLYYHLIAQ